MNQGFILYLNLWGTAAKLAEGDDGEVYLKPAELIPCQRRFQFLLENLRRDFRVQSAGDIAYVFSTDLNHLVKAAVTLFNHMLQVDGAFHLWPLRGAIASTAEPDARDFVGMGVVRAAYLEKAGLKGLRLFMTDEAIKYLDGPFKVRESNIRGELNHEINWLQEPSREFVEWMEKCAEHLLEVDSNYCRQLGSSIKDLARWLLKSSQ